MKKISWKEVLFLTAPIAIIALGFWGARFREEKWPTQPRIVECRVRPATPLEISQGANIGVTVRAFIPGSPEMNKAHPSLKYSVKSQGGANGKSVERERLCTVVNATPTVGQREMVENFAYAWPRNKKQLPDIAKVEILFSKGKTAPVVRQFELNGDDVALPNLAQVRHNNFRVTKVMMLEIPSPSGTNDQKIHFDVDNVTNDFPQLRITAQSVGKWVLQDGSEYAPASTGIQQEVETQATKVTIHFYSYGKNLVSPKPGEKIRGQLSINRGWPQEIIFEWPKEISKYPALTKLKFSTKLAPLPK